ncbi:lysophospholipid acyltransferase family protein [Microbaculum marinum]|uniref:Lysophospholipid acyltransferase family protein n=1 Tax=Microbaculum marinum TaxID=1764581 RepID=A0AAW9RQ13_9HYPH
MRKRLFDARWVQVSLGAFGAAYLRFVYRTSRFTVEPPDVYERLDGNLPVILAFWHGQHFLMPFIKKPYHRARVLISRHRDGEINAQTAQRLGIGTIRGSGDINKGKFHVKGGPVAFREMLSTLEEGINVALTADVPKISRRAGLGIVKLAQQSGRPIIPVAIATRRRIEMKSWDKAAINLPFSRGAAVAGDPIFVAADTDRDGLEAYRRRVEESLETCTRRAYEMADGKADA